MEAREYDPLADPFSIEQQIKRAEKGLKAKPRKSARIGQRFARELDKLQKAEAKMLRAFRAYDKQRAITRRIEKQLDKL